MTCVDPDFEFGSGSTKLVRTESEQPYFAVKRVEQTFKKNSKQR